MSVLRFIASLPSSESFNVGHHSYSDVLDNVCI
jgi:hypothetical protein